MIFGVRVRERCSRARAKREEKPRTKKKEGRKKIRSCWTSGAAKENKIREKTFVFLLSV